MGDWGKVAQYLIKTRVVIGGRWVKAWVLRWGGGGWVGVGASTEGSLYVSRPRWMFFACLLCVRSLVINQLFLVCCVVCVAELLWLYWYCECFSLSWSWFWRWPWTVTSRFLLVYWVLEFCVQRLEYGVLGTVWSTGYCTCG